MSDCATLWTVACQATLSMGFFRQEYWSGLPLLSPGVWSNSCPLSWWCYLTISSSTIPFSCPQSFPASGSFPISQLFASDALSTRASASSSLLPMNIQDCFPLGWTNLITFNSQESSPAPPHFESTDSSVLSLLYGPSLMSIHDYWKNHSFD